MLMHTFCPFIILLTLGWQSRGGTNRRRHNVIPGVFYQVWRPLRHYSRPDNWWHVLYHVWQVHSGCPKKCTQAYTCSIV